MTEIAKMWREERTGGQDLAVDLSCDVGQVCLLVCIPLAGFKIYLLDINSIGLMLGSNINK